MEREGVLSAVTQGLKLYAAVVRDAPRYPLKAVKEYEDWFKTDFLTGLLKRLTLVNGRWKATPESHLLIGRAGKQAAEGCRKILSPVLAAWIEREYPKFWQQGLEYATVTAKMQGLPVPEAFNDADIAQISIMVTGEIATQQDHVDHHRRYVERCVSSGLQLGWTMERFMEAMSTPAGITGFPFGNTRYSWRTHVTRMIEGRARSVFASAAESRALREVQT
jgi:hypothetical protein